MSTGMSIFVTVVTLLNIFACYALIRWTMKTRSGEAKIGEETGYTWDDGQLAELNNPMPRWWLMLFYITIVFGLVYLALFPGLGNWKGLLGWTQEGRYEAQMERAADEYGPIFAALAEKDIVELSTDPESMKIGLRLFNNYCTQCHGSDGKGAIGFPNLADNDWQWGGEPEAIKQSILVGRRGVMPAHQQILGDEAAVDDMVNYVQHLSGMADLKAGSTAPAKFAVCAGCHGAEGKGNPMLGAPNLTDDIWLYSGSAGSIKETLMNGRMGEMPAHKDFLGEEKVHVLAAYVYSLSQ